MRRLILFFVCAAALFATDAKYDGAKVHYESYGKGSDAVVFVHGWTCDLTFWRGQAPVYNKHRALLIDLPGHGQSEKPEVSYTQERFARAVEAVRVEQKVDKIVLVGHSMGTPVIRQYAHLYPQHVAALVLVDGVVLAPPPQGAPPPAPILDPAKIMSAEGLQLRENMIKTMFTPKTTKDVQDRVLKMMLAAPPATAAGAMVATFDPSGTNSDARASRSRWPIATA